MPIALASSDAEISRCFPVMQQLRLHLVVTGFVERVRRQTQEVYRLAYLDDEGEIRSVAGFRIQEMLAWGKILYVDDLVASDSDRSRGYGGQLFDWLVEHGRANGCEQLHLDSGVQRFAAHRFYLRKRMEISSHHFSLKL